jgi:hypothetical protein
MKAKLWEIAERLGSRRPRLPRRVARLVLAVGIWLCAALGGLAVPGTAAAGTVYVAGSNGDFGTIDLNSGTFTPIGTLGPLNGGASAIFGMGFIGSTLYGLDNNINGASLYTINTTNAATTLVGPARDASGQGYNAVGATTENGTIYGLTFATSGNNLLYTVNKNTAQVKVIGVVSLTGATGSPDGLMAFNSSGTLFTDEIGGSEGDLLYSVNPNTAAATFIGPFGFGLQIFAGVFSNGTLYGFDFFGNIYTINTTNGALTFVASYQNNGLQGAQIDAAALAPVPEPATITLLGIGMASMAVYGWRRRKAAPACWSSSAIRREW